MFDFFGWTVSLLVSLFVIGMTSDFLYEQAEFKPTGLVHDVDSANSPSGDTTGQ